jgi:hypothetical protein
MGSRWPFALFVLVDLEHQVKTHFTITQDWRHLQIQQTINELITASIGPYAPTLWLATDSYDDAPQKQYDYGNGTIPPIPEEFKSPWIGRRIDDLVKWLKVKPEDADVNDRHVRKTVKRAVYSNM